MNWTTSASANPATGTGASFTTRWSATGNQTVTATCGGVTKTVTVAVHSLDIQINNTTATNDDLVVLNSTHPAQQFNVNCQMRLQGPSVGNVTVVLSNPDGRLRFPGPGNTTVNLTLDAAGAFSPFTISGNAASAAIGDAVIHIALTNGSEITTKNVTVVSFDQGSMQLTQGNAYNFVGPAATAVSYAAAGNLAVSFSSSARLRPAGVDCTVPQLKDLRMAIMQETSAMDFETTWDTPTIAFTGATQPVTVPATRRSTRVFDPAVAQPINDGFNLATDHAFPLYSKLAAALQPPSGCSGSAAAQSTDGPNHPTSPTSQLPIQDGTGATIATVTWTNRINTTRVQNFRTFCAVFNQVSNAFFSLREATWSLNTDSAAAAPQLASVNADAPAAANPTAVAPQANNVAQPETFSAVGGATKSFP